MQMLVLDRNRDKCSAEVRGLSRSGATLVGAWENFLTYHTLGTVTQIFSISTTDENRQW